MAHRPKPVHRFRIYPSPGTPWRYEVCLFASERPMYDYGRAVWNQDSENYHAVCLSLACTELKRSRKMGEMLFSLRNLTTGLIVHECVHGAHHHFQLRLGQHAIVINSEGSGHATEEAVALFASNLVSQMFKELEQRCIKVK